MRACDLEHLLREQSLDVAESAHLEPGYSAYLIRAGDGGGIMLSAGQSPGRRRFSIAHELGHFLIPKHKNEGISGYCLSADMRVRIADAKRIEWEANDFAAELLMPQNLFRKDVQTLEPSIASIERLASEEFYSVSRLAAAWRFVQLTRECVALVVSTAGRVSWIVRSESFSLPLTEKNQLVQAATVCASVRRGEGASAKPVLVDTGAWLDYAVAVRGDLYESAYEISTLDQVVSLLWVDKASEAE